MSHIEAPNVMELEGPRVITQEKILLHDAIETLDDHPDWHSLGLLAVIKTNNSGKLSPPVEAILASPKDALGLTELLVCNKKASRALRQGIPESIIASDPLAKMVKLNRFSKFLAICYDGRFKTNPGEKLPESVIAARVRLRRTGALEITAHWLPGVQVRAIWTAAFGEPLPCQRGPLPHEMGNIAVLHTQTA